MKRDKDFQPWVAGIKVQDMTINIENVENQARQLLDSRVASVRALVKTRQHVSELQAQLAEAEREDKKAYVRAMKDGWSEDELKKLGLDNSAAAKRRTRRSSGDTGVPQPSTEDSDATR